jgi:hypothetical protein
MHTTAHHLYRSQSIQHRTTTTKPQSLPFVPELLVILIKMNEQNLFVLTMYIPRVLQYLERKPKTVPLDPHILIPWRDC